MKTCRNLALLGLVLCVACDQPRHRMDSASSSSKSSADAASTETRLVSLKVEGMTCPNGCYPSVRSAIAKQMGVIDVELAPQAKEDVIDNPVVHVKYTGNLDFEAMVKAIGRAGFEAETIPN